MIDKSFISHEFTPFSTEKILLLFKLNHQIEKKNE